ENMTEKLVASLGDRIFSDVEKRLVVSGPNDAGGAFNFLRKDLARSQILDLKQELSITRVVGAVCEQVSIITGNKGIDAHELLALGQFILIEHDLFRRIQAAFLATV